jgi:hypothetical protein
MPLMLPPESLGLGGIVATLRRIAHRRQLRRGEQLQLPHKLFSRRPTRPGHCSIIPTDNKFHGIRRHRGIELIGEQTDRRTPCPAANREVP